MTHRICKTSFASVYPHHVAKAERKGRTKAEVDEIIRWLTGYSQAGLEAVLGNGADFESFFAEAPAMNPDRALIKAVVCGVRVEEVEEPLMREICLRGQPARQAGEGASRWRRSCGGDDPAS